MARNGSGREKPLFRETHLPELIQDYVRQRAPHAAVDQESFWEEFRQLAAVNESASSLLELYRNSSQVDQQQTPEVDRRLQEGLHYTWFNDVREGLKAKGFRVFRTVTQSPLEHSLPYSPLMTSLANSLSDLDSKNSTSDGDSRTTVSDDSTRARSKKRQITDEERFLQIKRNLAQNRRRRRTNRRRRSAPLT